MFTIEQIKTAHSKVKSGADFPRYIKEIKQLGVAAYETWVTDGHTNYTGQNKFSIKTEPQYENLEIANTSNREQFQYYLNTHQQGQTGYAIFCQHCAQTGVEKWVADLTAMTCTYFDKTGKKILEEKIPG